MTVHVASALDDCRVCMQKRKRLDTEFCSSRAAEEASRKVWVMIEFTNLLLFIQGFPEIPQGYPTFKGKQGRRVCRGAPARNSSSPQKTPEDLRISYSGTVERLN